MDNWFVDEWEIERINARRGEEVKRLVDQQSYIQNNWSTVSLSIGHTNAKDLVSKLDPAHGRRFADIAMNSTFRWRDRVGKALQKQEVLILLCWVLKNRCLEGREEAVTPFRKTRRAGLATTHSFTAIGVGLKTFLYRASLDRFRALRYSRRNGSTTARVCIR